MNLEQIWDLVLGGITVAGVIQWAKAWMPKVPSKAWGVVSAVMAAGYALAPAWIRFALGILAVSQLGYETLVQPVKRTLGGKDEG